MTRRWLVLGLALVAIVLAAQASPGHALVLAIGLLIGHALGGWLRQDRFAQRRAILTRKSGGESADRVAALIEAMAEPVVVLDRRGTVLLANGAARTAFPSLATGQPLSFSLRDPALLDALAAALRDGARHTVDLVERVPVERTFACAVSTLAGDARPGEAAAVIVMRETSRERAVETMRADFIANASHELRTPLASVLGFIETLQGPAKNDAAARERFLAVMATQARRMARLVDDLLSLSRMEMKKHIAPSATVDLAALVDHVALALSELARERGVEIVVNRLTTRTEALGDRDDLLSVFDNLVENAIKYGNSGGRVEVTIADAPAPGDVIVTVRDFGAGIAPEHLPRLTERFYRVDNTLSRAEGGTGLGLALVKHTINRHRGRLAIDSRLGEGTVFTLTLPRAR